MERILELGAYIAEGPVWDSSTSTWLFVDITAGLVHRLEPESGELVTFSVGQPVSAVVPTSCGRLLLVSVHGLILCERDGTGQKAFGDRLETDPVLLLNDAKVDSSGRLWTGSRDGERGSRGHLFRIHGDGRSTVMLEGVSVSNGLGWSPDDRSFYYIDSLTYAVRVFDFDTETGEIANGREFCAFHADSGLPDGLSVDEHGGVWIAHFGAGTITRHDPSGALVAEHRFPVPNVTSLAFGGPLGSDALVTTARYKMTDAELAHSPMAGDVFVASWGVRGVPTHPFVVA
jgi:sugar lactone lactonase YvrE